MTTDSQFETLDPEQWEDMRALAHRMVDDAIDYLADVAERPVWQPVPPELESRFDEPAPREPSDPAAVYDEFQETIMPYPMGNIHPRFWGWYVGSGTIMGALGDFMAAVMNANLGGGNHVANRVEAQVIDWVKAMVGFPTEASGLLVSGGSMANFVGLAVARQAKAGYDIRQEGVAAAEAPMIIYTSTETHSSVQRAVELLGLGNANLRKVAVDDAYRIDIDALQAAIESDRAAGLHPICVVATSGTINTGAIDDLNAVADICAAEDLWFHVDGAIGAVAVLSPDVVEQLAGIERADSLGLDLHKWLHVPFEAGCVLVRNRAIHRDTFFLVPEYLASNERGMAAGTDWFSEYGLQLSRQFRALKVWMSIKEHGLDRLGRMIDRNVAQAHYTADLIAQSPELELMAPVGLDIVCFRFNPGGLTDEELNALNRQLLGEMHEQGIAVPSYTTLNGRYCLRIAIANHRSTQDDFDVLVRETVRLGREMAARL